MVWPTLGSRKAKEQNSKTDCNGIDMCSEKKKKCMEYEVEGARPRGRPEDMTRGCAKRLPST